MKLRIDDIKEGGFDVNADSTVNPWLQTVFTDVFGTEKFTEEDGGRLNLQLFRDDKNVTIIGGAIIKFHPNCDRCLTNFSKQQQIPIHLILAPVYLKKGKRAESNTEDEDFGYYENDEIDIENVVREQMILMQQMVNICRESCKGLCPTCGKNLNDGPCKCKKKEEIVSPFAVLKKRPLKKSKT